MTQPIRIEGLAQLNRALKQVDGDLPKALRLALNQATDLVVGYARPRVPRRSGRAAASIKAASTRTKARVSGGGARAPYYPWLDFGGRVGRSKSVRRPFLREGRYIYKGYFQARDSDEFSNALDRALTRVIREAGLEVTDRG